MLDDASDDEGLMHNLHPGADAGAAALPSASAAHAAGEPLPFAMGADGVIINPGGAPVGVAAAAAALYEEAVGAPAAGGAAQLGDAVEAAIVLDDDEGEEWFLRICKQRGGAAHGPRSRMRDADPGIPVRFLKENFRFMEK